MSLGLYNGTDGFAQTGVQTGVATGCQPGTRGNFNLNKKIVQTGLCINYDFSSKACWPSDTNIKTYTDLSNNGNTGTLFTGPGTYTQLYKGGMNFPGTLTVIKTTPTASLANPPNALGDFTIQAAFVYRSTGTLAISAGFGQTFPELRLVNNQFQILRSYVTNIGTFTNFTGSQNTPYVVALTKTYTGTTYRYDLYINGVYRSSLSNASNFLASYPVIGGNGNGFDTYQDVFVGDIYAYQWYNVALQPYEIYKNYTVLAQRFNFKPQ